MEDILERGFQLAYFIFPTRPLAVLILSSAVNKLKTQHGRESRRTYWRDKYLKRGITRITREESDMLQWLIFNESDPFEKAQEAASQSTPRDMVLRYIKSLVRMTSAMSSFHVNIGLHRLLHNYTTAEAQQVYESITDRYPGADEYRRAKSVLMNKLEERFDGMLKTGKTQHGEIRFESAEQQGQWEDLVNTCLKEFIPWSTRNTCPASASFEGVKDKLSLPIVGIGTGETDQNQIEMYRCHVFIDPICFRRLAQALSIEPPSHRLDVPRFFMDNSDNSSPSSLPPQPPKLSADERKSVASFAAAQAERRQKAAPANLSVVIDGKECACLDASGARHRQIEIREGAALMEIWTQDAGAPLLLASHKIAYTGAQGIAQDSLALRFTNSAELVLKISAGNQSSEGPQSALVTMTFVPGAQKVEAFARWLRPAPRFALAAMIFALGWFLAINTHRQPSEVRPDQPRFVEEEKSTLVPRPSPTPAPTMQASGLPVAYRLVPDELVTRSVGSSGMPSVIVPASPVLLQLELPITATGITAKSFRCSLKPFLKDEPILTVSRLTAKRSASGVMVVTLPLPSTLIEANEDYSLDLSMNGLHGKVEELGTFTFHAKDLK
jgi:hypothetical protein